VSDDDRKATLISLLTEHKGQVAAVARAMGKARMQIHRWIQRYDLDLETYRRL
jgi:transposase-like protein